VEAINTSQPATAPLKTASFRWTYVVFPLAVLLIAIVLAAVCYGRLPQDTAYRFSGGAPVNWTGRSSVLGWALGLQAVFVLLALGITLLISEAARRMNLADTPLNRRLFGIIGNVVALPQVIIAYAMLDVFLYNIYGKTLPSLLAFALLVMLGGGVVLAVFLARAFRETRKLKAEIAAGRDTDVR
jgi:uncharacterized membrane protein